MISHPNTIDIPSKGSVSSVLTVPDNPHGTALTGVIVAHGAGNDMHNDMIVAFTDGLADAGYATLRFNFLYKEKGKKSPDGQATLVHTWQHVYAWFKSNIQVKIARVIAAGKSMGGRVAAQMAAAGQLDPAALIFLGYPLHAPGRTDQLRDAPLYEIKAPMLFFEGTKDPLCNLDSLRRVLGHLKNSVVLETIEDGNHSFKLPASSSRPAAAVYQQIVGNKCRVALFIKIENEDKNALVVLVLRPIRLESDPENLRRCSGCRPHGP